MYVLCVRARRAVLDEVVVGVVVLWRARRSARARRVGMGEGRSMQGKGGRELRLWIVGAGGRGG